MNPARAVLVDVGLAGLHDKLWAHADTFPLFFIVQRHCHIPDCQAIIINVVKRILTKQAITPMICTNKMIIFACFIDFLSIR